MDDGASFISQTVTVKIVFLAWVREDLFSRKPLFAQSLPPLRAVREIFGRESRVPGFIGEPLHISCSIPFLCDRVVRLFLYHPHFEDAGETENSQWARSDHDLKDN